MFKICFILNDLDFFVKLFLIVLILFYLGDECIKNIIFFINGCNDSISEF